MNFLVSIIIPCYNAGEFVSEAIASALHQTYPDIELIIVDDGSTDNSENEIRGFEDRRIKYFRQSNRGQAAASNFGIGQSKGDYIKFFDADDVMNPEHIEKMVKRLEGNNDAVAFCEWGAFYGGDPAAAKFNLLPNLRDMKPAEWLKIELRQYCDMIAGWRWMIPRALLQRAGGWDERLTLNNDFEFSLRLLSKARQLLFAGGAKIFYRWATSQALSQRKSEKSYRDAILATDLGCASLLAMENSEEMKTICRGRYGMWLARIPEEYEDLRLSLQQRADSSLRTE